MPVGNGSSNWSRGSVELASWDLVNPIAASACERRKMCNELPHSLDSMGQEHIYRLFRIGTDLVSLWSIPFL
jgi:hypothetical protein